MVTALEDIGIGNLDVAIAMIAAASNADWRRRLGGDGPVLDVILTLPCSTVKDRSADHVDSIVRHEPVPDDECRALMRASRSALLAITASSDLPLLYQIRAGLIAAGRYGGAEALRRGGPKDVVDLFGIFEDLGTPPLLVAACRIYARRCYDPLPVLVPFLWQIRAGEKSLRDNTAYHRTARELIEGVPGYAMDPLHTRIGREAIDLWSKSYSRRLPWSTRQIGIVVWNSESAACDRTLLWSTGEGLRTRAHHADLIARGVPAADHDSITAWVRGELQALHCARRSVWMRSKYAVDSKTNPKDLHDGA
jgi:hypothetical protein